MKLNMDGASLGNPRATGVGGIIRNCSGGWVKGFSRSVGFATSITTEFQALRDGLILATQLGIQDIEVELDAKIVLDLVQSNTVVNNSFLPLLNDSRSILSSFHQVRVGHTFREANRCADALARIGCSLKEDFVDFDNPPSVEIESYVTTDANGMYYGRLTTATLATVASQLFLLIKSPFNPKKKKKSFRNISLLSKLFISHHCLIYQKKKNKKGNISI